jgi:integrase
VPGPGLDGCGEREGAAGYNWLCSQRDLAPLLDYLAAQGVLSREDRAPGSAAEVLLARFSRYLQDERAVGASTTCLYVKRARRFLARCAPGGDVSDLSPGEVTAAVLAECTAVSAGSGQYFVAALRSFLRFCYLEGLTSTDLSAAALAVTGRRTSRQPRGMSRGDAQALLATCDRRRAVGRRNYAIILLLARLGLRAGEVAALRLEDIDWRAGELGTDRTQLRQRLAAIPGLGTLAGDASDLAQHGELLPLIARALDAIEDSKLPTRTKHELAALFTGNLLHDATRRYDELILILRLAEASHPAP